MAKLNIRIHEGKEDIKAFNPRTVKIGDRVWMQENLTVNDGGDGITYNPDNGQYYYTWGAAMRLAKSIPGWHLPSAEEWNTAAEACGATIVDNDYTDDPYMRDYEDTEELYRALKVLPLGYGYGGDFYGVGKYAYLWSATEYDSGYSYGRGFGSSGAMYSHTFLKGYGFSVRLVKD